VGAGRAAALLDDAAERSRTTARDRLARLRTRSPAVAQTALAAAGAWLVATEAVGHQRAFFAPIAAIVVLGVTQGRHARRAIELAVGVALGILVADLIVQGIGSGWLAIGLVVALAMAAAIVLGGEALVISQAATSATLVATFAQADHVTLARAVDASVGGAVALIVSFLLFPVDPVRLTRRAAGEVLDELALVLDELASALQPRDRAGVQDAMVRARALDDRAVSFADACAMGLEIATYSPLRRRRRPILRRYVTAAAQAEIAVRNVRVLARGALRAVDLADNVPPEAIRALRELAAAVRALAPSLDDPARAGRAREHAVRAAARATLSLERTANLSTSVIVGQVRSTATDLLRAIGIDHDEATAAVRAAAAQAARDEAAGGTSAVP
jgi:uncharacterized membrane protein YgaE (UPF0421/DUF939 family)